MAITEKKYFIAWKAERTGATGKGPKSYPYEEASQIRDDLNRQDFDIKLTHWLEEDNDH